MPDRETNGRTGKICNTAYYDKVKIRFDGVIGSKLRHLSASRYSITASALCPFGRIGRTAKIMMPDFTYL